MASGQITSTFTKLWYSPKYNSQDGATDFVNGTSYYYNNSGSSYSTTSFYGTNFEAIRGLPNLKITGFSFKINCGRYNTSSGSKTYFSYRFVTGMASGSNNYSDSITSDAVTVVEGSIARQDYYFTQDDLPEVLTWMQNNINNLLNGYTTGSFGFRTYCRYAQMRAAELTLYYTYGESVTGISVSPSTLSLNVGGTYTLAKTIIPSGASNQNVVWSTNNPSIATVDSNGKVTAVAKGTAIITCTSSENSNIKGTCAVTVNQQATGISIVPTSKQILLGTAKPNLLDFSKWYSNSFSASNAHLSKNEYGLTLTSTANDAYTNTYHMNTSPLASDIAVVDNFGFAVTAGKNYTFAVDINQNSANNSEMFVFWYNSSKAYISLNNSPLTGSGTLKFTVTAPSGAAYACIRVDNNVAGYTNLYTNIRVQEEDEDVSAVGQCNVYAKVLPYNVSNENYTLSSNNTSVATVSNNGLITAVSAGTATITATSSDGSHKATCTITVVSANIFKIANGSIFIQNMILGTTNIKSAYIGNIQIFKK